MGRAGSSRREGTSVGGSARTYDEAMHPVDPGEQMWRTALSALFDGEEPVVAVGDLLQHLSACASCAAWLDDAAQVNADVRRTLVEQPALGETVVNRVDVTLCGCRTGEACLCADCQCGPDCTCRQPLSLSAS